MEKLQCADAFDFEVEAVPCQPNGGTPPKCCPPPLHREGSAMHFHRHSFKQKTVHSHAVLVEPPATDWNSWKTGIFDCCGDFGTCCMTAVAPCVTFGRVAQFVDGGFKSCVANGGIYCLLSMVGLQCCYSWGYRERLRDKLKLPGNRRSDFYVHCLCECCALCQEYEEVKLAAGARGSISSQSAEPEALSAPRINTMIH